MTNRRHFLATMAGAALGSSRLITSRRVIATWAAPAVRRWTAVQKLLDGYIGGKKMAGAIGQAAYTVPAELSAAIEEGLKETA